MNIKFYGNRIMATTLSLCMLGTCKIAMKSNTRKSTDIACGNNYSYSNMLDLNNSVTELRTKFNLYSSNNAIDDKLKFVSSSDIEDIISTTLKDNTPSTTIIKELTYLKQNAELLQSNNKTQVYLDKDGKVYIVYNGRIVNTFENKDYYEGSLKIDNKKVTTTTTISKLQDIINHSIVYEQSGNTVVYEDSRDNRIYIVCNGTIVSEYIDKDAYNAASKMVDNEELKTYVKTR